MPPVVMERPTIKIFVNPEHDRERTLFQLCCGIEEESVPYEVVTASRQEAVALAWEASRVSRLEVGLGLDSDALVLHYGKLERNKPLFQITARAPEADIRAIGANAARLVKKLPFKPLTEL